MPRVAILHIHQIATYRRCQTSILTGRQAR
jgi:hypothetical protein